MLRNKIVRVNFVRAYVGLSQGRRPVGCPNYRWKDVVAKDFRELQAIAWHELSQDREGWRLLVSHHS